MNKEMLKELKEQFIEFLKYDFLIYYDGFGWYQKLNLLCDDITYNDSINMIYHNLLSNKKFVKLIEAVNRSSHARVFARHNRYEDFMKLYNMLKQYNILKEK